MPNALSSPAIALVEIHYLPHDPPKGDPERRLLLAWHSGTCFIGRMRDVTAEHIAWWSELPVPPVEGALTLDDLRGWERSLTYAIVETDFDGDGNPDVVALRDRVSRAIADAERGGTDAP